MARAAQRYQVLGTVVALRLIEVMDMQDLLSGPFESANSATVAITLKDGALDCLGESIGVRKPIATEHKTLVCSLANSTAERSRVFGDLGGLSLKLHIAMKALYGRHRSASLSMGAGVAAGRGGSIFQQVLEYLHGLLAMRARQSGDASNRFSRSLASVIAILTPRPNRSGEFLGALGAGGHSSIFPWGCGHASTASPMPV